MYFTVYTHIFKITIYFISITYSYLCRYYITYCVYVHFFIYTCKYMYNALYILHVFITITPHYASFHAFPPPLRELRNFPLILNSFPLLSISSIRSSLVRIFDLVKKNPRLFFFKMKITWEVN